jgi:Protein of unknown function (DUF3617)
MLPRLVVCVAAVAILAAPTVAQDVAPMLQAGSYQVTHRLELPHVERWAVDRTTTICVAGGQDATPAALPVLSGGNPFGDCVARDIRQDGTQLSYDIRCEGRDSAKAHAIYTLSSGGFKGRIAMGMGAKNMTMTEVQTGHRIGECVSHATFKE